jgi:hypothetical protein
MSRRLFFLIACTLAILTIALGVFTGIKTKNLSKQYESSMDRITVVEEQLVQLHSTLEEIP